MVKSENKSHLFSSRNQPRKFKHSDFGYCPFMSGSVMSVPCMALDCPVFCRKCKICSLSKDCKC